MSFTDRLCVAALWVTASAHALGQAPAYITRVDSAGLAVGASSSAYTQIGDEGHHYGGFIVAGSVTATVQSADIGNLPEYAGRLLLGTSSQIASWANSYSGTHTFNNLQPYNIHARDPYNAQIGIHQGSVTHSSPGGTNRIINVSSRSWVVAPNTGGSNNPEGHRGVIRVHVGGSGGTVRMIARAWGPSLSGVTQRLANPLLYWYGPTGSGTNDNWQSGPDAAFIQASGHAPYHSNESALLVKLAPGTYVFDAYATSGTGVAMIDIVEVNVAPTAAWTSLPGTPTAGANFGIAARASDDDGNLVSVHIQRDGDGTVYSGSSGNGDQRELTATYNLPQGTYTFRSWGVDATGAEGPKISHVVTVTQAAVAPTTTFWANSAAQPGSPTTPITINTGGSVTFYIRGQDSNADLRYLILDQVQADGVTWMGNFGTSPLELANGNADYTRAVSVSFPTAGTYYFRGSVYDWAGTGGYRFNPTNWNVQVTVNNPNVPPSITSPASMAATLNVGASYQTTASGSPTSYGFQWLSSAPGTHSFNTATGLLTFTPTTGGSFSFRISASNAYGTGTRDVSLTVSAPPVVDMGTVPSGQAGNAIGVPSTATDVNGDMTWHGIYVRGPNAVADFTGFGGGWTQLPGTAPAGGGSSSISRSWTPASSGYYQFYAAAADAAGNSAHSQSRTNGMPVVFITPAPSPNQASPVNYLSNGADLNVRFNKRVTSTLAAATNYLASGSDLNGIFERVEQSSSAFFANLNEIYSFNWNGQSVSLVSTTVPTGGAANVLQFNGNPHHVGIDRAQHGFNFVAGNVYTFGFWARTTSGSRTIDIALSEDGNSGLVTAVHTIDTTWRWVSVQKVYSSPGASPRAFYTYSHSGVPFQAYGARVVRGASTNYFAPDGRDLVAVFAPLDGVVVSTSVSYTVVGNHTFTVPAGVTQVTVEQWGAGGGGGFAGSQGGGGAYVRAVVNTSPGAVVGISVGGPGRYSSQSPSTHSTWGSPQLPFNGGGGTWVVGNGGQGGGFTLVTFPGNNPYIYAGAGGGGGDGNTGYGALQGGPGGGSAGSGPSGGGFATMGGTSGQEASSGGGGGGGGGFRGGGAGGGANGAGGGGSSGWGGAGLVSATNTPGSGREPGNAAASGGYGYGGTGGGNGAGGRVIVTYSY